MKQVCPHCQRMYPCICRLIHRLKAEAKCPICQAPYPCLKH